MSFTTTTKTNVKRPRMHKSLKSGESNALPKPVILFGKELVPENRQQKPIPKPVVLFGKELVPENRQQKPSIFSISSPVREPLNLKDVGFLEQCFYCEMEFEKGADIYMYRDFRFCSVECRHYQMDEDNFQ